MANNPNKKNHYLHKLEQHLYHLNPTEPPELSEITAYLGQTQSNWITQYFPSPRSRKKRIQEPFPIQFVQRLYAGFRVPPSTFELLPEHMALYKASGGKIKKDHYTADKLDRVIGKWSPRSTLIDCIDLKYVYHAIDVEDRKRFIEMYTAAISRHFRNAECSIVISEILKKGDIDHPNTHLRPVLEAKEVIFDDIEQQLRDNENLHYTRILTFPYSDPKYNPSKNKMVCAIHEVSSTSYRHICRCLKEFGHMKVKVKKGDTTVEVSKVRFYVAPAVRQVHYGIIENTNEKILLSKYYKYISEEKNVLVPDILYIEKLLAENDSLHKLYNIYRDESDTWVENENNRITSENIGGLTMSALNITMESKKNNEPAKNRAQEAKKKRDFYKELFKNDK